jgi:hypothetical protein
MKMKAAFHATAFSIALAGTALLAFSGCASTSASTGKGKHALVCPQCKMVEIPGDPEYQSQPTTLYRDTCRGCQGALTTFFKEGKWKHKCSVCKDSPFTCPVYHPTP